MIWSLRLEILSRLKTFDLFQRVVQATEMLRALATTSNVTFSPFDVEILSISLENKLLLFKLRKIKLHRWLLKSDELFIRLE